MKLSRIFKRFKIGCAFLCFGVVLSGVLKSSSLKMVEKGGIQRQKENFVRQDSSRFITVFMCGDVMLGRGIDQIMRHPGDPVLYEGYVKNAKAYVKLAENLNGPIPYPVSSKYVWGIALEEFERMLPDVKIINLETSITKSKDYWPYKGINYKMHPKNIDVITSAKIDFCSLANNHVLDWGYSGLQETLETLKNADILYAGAGKNSGEAMAPAVLEVKEKGRLIVFSYGSRSSGVPFDWAALKDKPGVNYLKTLFLKAVKQIKEQVKNVKKERDIVIVSVHWGGNWGYEISPKQTAFAHNLIDSAGVDIVHGHSSHHVKGIEVYKDKLILYGSGDFINDYEGIRGKEDFRGDIALMYFAKVDPNTGKLFQLEMIPTQTKKFRVNRAGNKDVQWLMDVLNREGKKFGTKIKKGKNHSLTLLWE